MRVGEVGEAGEVVVESVGAEGAGVVDMVWRAESNGTVRVGFEEDSDRIGAHLGRNLDARDVFHIVITP